ncbi:MAG: EthD family reductase [Deltaproteobacteria bacterium]|nr:EthD family reductase [Deltaproteobacteria bacterium]
MIKVSVFYPNESGKRFDLEYYVSRHKPMVLAKLGPLGLNGLTVDKGLMGGTPGSAAPYVCIGHMRFETMEAYKQAMKAHGKEVLADIPNFTDITPVVQVSEIQS